MTVTHQSLFLFNHFTNAIFIHFKNRNLSLSPYLKFLSCLTFKSLLYGQISDTLVTVRAGYKTCNILHTTGLFILVRGKKSSQGITWRRALHVLHSRRLRRDYPRPDVSLSKEKTCCPLRSSHILPLGKRQAAGRRRSVVWSITHAVSEYARFQV